MQYSPKKNSVFNIVYKSSSFSPTARQTLMVKDGAFIHKIDYLSVNIGHSKLKKNIKIYSLVQKFCSMGGFCLLIELHRHIY